MLLRMIILILCFLAQPIYSEDTHDHHNHQAISLDSSETYMCPMHPHIKQDHPGSCPICGMDLVLLEKEDQAPTSQSTSRDQSSHLDAPHFGHHHISEHGQTFTCPMHPHIKQNEAGTCPICGMDLVLLEEEDTSVSKSDESIKISNASRRLAGIETETVEEKSVYQNLRAVGSIDFDEGKISNISAYVGGRIEKLYANYTGVEVKKGEHLAEFYSPELYTAQIEFLEARKSLNKLKGGGTMTQKAFIKNAQRKLKELGMSRKQIRSLEKNGKASSIITLDSNVTGTVIKKDVVEGSYVKSGQIIYKVADLSTVWLLLDMFPEETSFLKFGLKVKATIRSIPDMKFEGRISFISPVIDKKSRTVRVRVEIPNPKRYLKPGDFAQASILVPIGLNGKDAKIYDPELANKYIAPMHPQHISDHPGKCPVCGMKLLPSLQFGYTSNEGDLEKVLTVPRDAVLSVGKGHVVFVEEEGERFTLREVEIGPEVEDNRVVVLNGLHVGETVASAGVFLIDSQMQLSGKTSLLQISTDQDIPKMEGHNH